MKYIQLSRLNRDVSVIGVGCMRIARMTREEVSELVHTALDHGINFFDHVIFTAEAAVKKCSVKCLRQSLN